MKSGTFVEFSERKLHVHPHSQVSGIPVSRLIIDPAAPFQVYNDQNIGQIKRECGPLIYAEGEEFAGLVNDPDFIKLILCLTPHTNPLGRKLDVTACPAFLPISPEECLSLTVKHVLR